MQAVSRPSSHPLARLLAFAAVVRLAALIVGADGLSCDPDDYRGLAENLLAQGVLGHGTTPSAYRPPLYPLLLVPCVAMGASAAAAIGALHLALGVATVGGVYWLGRRWQLGGAAGGAAAMVACDPILVHQSTQVMTETAAAFLATLALIALDVAGERRTARWFAVAGACLALAALCRPTFLVWLACAAPFAIRHAPTWSARARLGAAYLAAAAAVLAPWTLRNHAQFGRPMLSTTHGGYTLWLANNASYYAFLSKSRRGEVWQAREFDAEVQQARLAGGGTSEIENDRREFAQACQVIREQPWMFLYASLVRVGRFWGLLPRQVVEYESRWRRLGRYATGAWYASEFALAAMGLWSVWSGDQGRGIRVSASPRLRVPASPHPASPLLPGLMLAASFTAVHAVFWTDLRMRAPVMPFVALVAAAGGGWRRAAIERRKALTHKEIH